VIDFISTGEYATLAVELGGTDGQRSTCCTAPSHGVGVSHKDSAVPCAVTPWPFRERDVRRRAHRALSAELSFQTRITGVSRS
jgi:hypothetical protein